MGISLKASLKLVLVLLFFVFTQKGFAQITFVKGYIITSKDDTLKGEIKINPKKEHDNYTRAFFRDSSGIQKNYKPNKIKGYGFENNHFVSVDNNDEVLFYKRLSTNGAIILYKSAFEVINKNVSSFDYEYYLFKTGDKKPTEVKENKFKKQMQEWMKDNIDFVSDYVDEKKLNVESAVDAINKYNAWKKNN